MNTDPKNRFDAGDELNKIAPALSQLKKQDFFTVPDGYFESMNLEVMQKIEALPGTETVSAKNPFQAPEGYFDALPGLVQQRIADEKSKRNAVKDILAEIFSNPIPIYTLAIAGIVLIIGMSMAYFTRTIHVTYSDNTNDNEQMNAAYLVTQLDESVLADVLAEETTIAEYQDESLENYLIDNDIDLNSITEQF